MRLDIPQEQPRRREGNDAAPGSSDGRAVRRKPPDNPVFHRLKSLEDHAPERSGDQRRTRPQAPRKPVEQPRERRRPVASADPRRPARATGNIVGLELRPEEKQLLREAGRFRVVRTADLRETLYNGKSRPLENDLRYLRDKGLVETTHINLRRDGQRRTIERAEVVTLTKDGRRLLLKQGELPKDQWIYAGLVKPREAEHDSQIYRAYQKEAQRIEDRGDSNLRVRLDFEMKTNYVINELLRFALTQEEDFQKYKASSTANAVRPASSAKPVTAPVKQQTEPASGPDVSAAHA